MRRRSISRRHRLSLRRRAELHDDGRLIHQHAKKGHNQPPTISPLIVPRSVARRMLSVSTSTLIRLEQCGKLDPLKLSESSNGVVYYRISNLEALIGGGNA